MPNKASIRQARYDAGHTERVQLKLNTKTDADILARLDAEPNKQGYIKRLIRNDIAKEEACQQNIK